VQTAIEAVVFADEVGNKGIFRLFIEHARRGNLLDFTLMKYRNAIRHGQGLTLVVCHVDHGHAETLMQVFDFHLHVFTQLLVQCAQRFVHQHQLWLEYQCASQCHALLLAARELGRIALGESIELHHAQYALDPFTDVGAVQPTY